MTTSTTMTTKNARETEKINLGLFLTAVCGQTDLLCAFLRLVLLSLVKMSWKKVVYSYFERDCRKKCTWQSRKVLWVVLDALFFKEIWKNGIGGHGHMFASAKGKQQKYVRQLQSSGTMYWSYPIFSLGIVPCTFCPTTFLEIAVCI